MKSNKNADSILFSGEAHAAKYNSGNWIARHLVNNFLKSIINIASRISPQQIHEIGCGEGHISVLLAKHGFKIRACDINENSLQVATREAKQRCLNIEFAVKSIYELDTLTDSADLVICCEVLEHLTDPELALQRLVAITQKDLIVSVPNEPIWHILNMVRGKYLYALGNTPGHFQHWTARQFVRFISKYADIVSVYSPLPWTVIHCKPCPGNKSNVFHPDT